MNANPQCLLSAKHFLLILMVSFGATVKLYGQQTAARPDRGANPGGTYSVSDIESINLQNGNVQLKIPLASLPPIAGGRLSFTLSLNYNSKLWNMIRNEQLGRESPYQTYIVETPQLSDAGGWSLFGGYSIFVRDARDDFDYRLPPPPDPTDPNYGEASVEYQRLTQNSWRKVVLRTPDGAEHELRPSGGNYPRYGGVGYPRPYLWGYYKDTPASTGQPMRYNSSDGTYISAIVNPAGHVSGVQWTIFLPDGTQVINYSNGIQRIRDNNGNTIKIFSDGNGTHYQDEQTGREIRVTYDPEGSSGYGQYTVLYNTVGGGLQHIDVNFGETVVKGKIYDVQNWNPNVVDEYGHQGMECKTQQKLDQPVRVVREIVFPDTEMNALPRKFTFNYNSDTSETAVTQEVRWTCGTLPESYARSASTGLGALSHMAMVSGAEVDYAYTQAGVHDFIGLNPPDYIARETLNRKTLHHDNVADQWDYHILNEPNSTVSSINNPDGSTVSQTFFPIDPIFARVVGNAWEVRSGLVYYETNGVTETWRHWVAGSQMATGSTGSTTVNPLVDAEYTAFVGSDKMSAKTYEHDFNGNVTQVKEYDWFNPSLVTRDADNVPIAPPSNVVHLRVTNTSYYNSAPDGNSPNSYMARALVTGVPSILNAAQETITGPAKTQFSYDDQSYGVAPTLGNLTSQSVKDNLDNKWITTSQTYGPYGNVATKTDARGNVTHFFYDDLTHALPNRIVVDPQNGTGPQESTTWFDFFTGAVTGTKDPNENISTIEYANQRTGNVDPFGRPGVTIGPVVNINGTDKRRRVTTTYYDSAHQVTVAADLNTETDQLLRTSTTSDQLGRVVLTEQTEDGANNKIYTQYVYHQMGKITLTSNPMRYGQSSTTDGWTRVTKDNAGRVTEVTTFGGSGLPSDTGTIGNWTGTVTTTYSANRVTVQDQDGKQRSSVSDSLGRLIEVYEDPNGANYLTSYSYDPLGNLLQVNQGAQIRTFTYDSLSRLRSATNPESGTVTYTYDDNGNLTQKTDARGVVANYAYDALNRNTTVSFLNDPSGTLPVNRVYDQAVKGKGRLYQSQTTGASGSLTTIDAYDAMGQPLTQRQHFYVNNGWSPSYTTQRNYTLAGSVNSETYPSGRIVNYSYDYAGRTNSFTGTLGDGVSRDYSTAILYSPAGSMTKEKFGTDTAIYNTLAYNSRGQLSEIRASTTYTGPADPNWDRGKFVNWYSQQCGGPACNSSDNNGNLRKQETFIPPYDQTNSTSWRQEFDYDNLNRLSRVKEFDSASTQLWQQEYNYDRWGNRTIHQVNTWGGGIPKLNFAVNTTLNNNQLTAPPGYTMSYDASGNLTADTYGAAAVSRVYDAENRMVSETQANNYVAGVYTYNADGQRVRRKVADVEIWQVYGMDGELLAEYPANGAGASPQKEYGYRNGQMLISAEAATSSASPTPTPGPISRIGVSTNSALGQTISLSKPAGIVNGDVLFAVIASSFAYGGVPIPAGWTPIRSVDQGAQIIHVDTYYRLVDGSEPAYWTWQLGSGSLNPNGNPNARATGTMVGYRGVNNATPIGESNVGCCDAGTTTSVTSITTTTPNNRVLAIFAEGMSNNTYTLPTGLTSVSTVTNGDPDWGNHHVVSEKVIADPGSTGDQTATNGKDTGSDAALLIALRPGFSGPPPNYVAFRDFSSVQGQGNWYYLSSSGAPINFIAATNQWKDDNETYGLLWSWGGHPGENADMVRQWRAPTNGTVRITGIAYDAHAGCGDGVVVSIKKGTQLLWQQTIEDGNSTGFNYDLTTTVATGDQINFVINKRSANNSCDSTFFNPKITYTVANINWMVTDQLGTPRMIFDKTGSLTNVKRHDYLPFGEELFAGHGARSSALGYSGDLIRQKFTSKERDNETNLYYFGARYYSADQGRFSSPDNFLNDTHVVSPQSWNLYAYVRNNPLRYIDPTGETVDGTDLTPEQRQQLIDDWKKKTGYRDVQFVDQDGRSVLAINTEAGFEGGSATARRELLEAQTSHFIFDLESREVDKQGSPVEFAQSRLPTFERSRRGLVFKISIDFEDFKELRGEKEILEANSIGIVVLHEIEHHLHGHMTDSLPNPGDVERRYINPIRRELGLPERQFYAPNHFSQAGQEQKFLFYKAKDETRKIVYWSRSQVERVRKP